MNASAVCELIAQLETLGLTVWLDGDCGIDALLGHHTRPQRRDSTLTGRRSEQLPPHNFYIDPEVLVGCVGLYEVPAAEEGAAIVSVDTGKDGPRHDAH